MRKSIQLYQVLGLAAILVVLGLTIYIALQRTQLFSEAGASEDPKFINITNNNADGFTVAWVTTKATQGFIMIPEEGLTFVEDEEKTKTHIIEITGLKAGTRYEFKIQSGSVVDDNQGANYEAYTTKYNFLGENQLLFGRIYGKESTIPLTEGYVTIHAETDTGALTNRVISTLNEEGGWQLDSSLLLNSALTQRFDIDQKVLVTVTIYSPELTDAVTRSYDLKLSETLQITDIFLGENVPWELPAVEDEDIEVTE